MVDTKNSQQIAYMPIVAAVGGFLAFMGVFIGWFDVSGQGAQRGTDHWTGKGTLVFAAVLIFAGLFGIVAKESTTKRMASLVATICGILCVLLAAVAFAQLDSVYSSVGASAAFGLYTSLVGGLIGAVGGIAVWSGSKS